MNEPLFFKGMNFHTFEKPYYLFEIIRHIRNIRKKDLIMEIYEICSFTFVKAFNDNEYGEGKHSATYSIMTNELLDNCWITNNNGELDYQESSFKDGIDAMFDFLEFEVFECEWKGAHVYVTINKDLALYSEKTLIETLIENDDYKLANAISLIS